MIEEKGRGVFSTRSFKKGDLVCEYAGDLIDYKEAKTREAKYGTDETIGSYMYFFEYQNKKYWQVNFSFNCIDLFHWLFPKLREIGKKLFQT